MSEAFDRKKEDARDRLWVEIDLEGRRHRRRLRKAGEKAIDSLTTEGEDFDADEVARTALRTAQERVYELDTAANNKKVIDAR